LIGLFTGIVAFGMETLEKWLISTRTDLGQHIIDSTNGSNTAVWAFYAGWCFVIVAVAAFLTVTIGPGAMGSGIAEIIAYLNGVNYPNFISW
jgi:H+/Cl- antiporter ClcA